MRTEQESVTTTVATWRPRRAPLILRAVLVLGYATWVLAIAQGWSGWPPPQAREPMWIWLPIVGVLGIYSLTIGTSARIRLSETELEVRNLRTHHIPLADIADIEARYWGLVITRRDLHAKSVYALGFPKSKAAQWLGRRVRADRIAQTISDAAVGAGPR